MTRKKSQGKAKASEAIIPVHLNRWYEIDRFPTEIASQGVARCACGCRDEHVVTWMPVQFSKHRLVLAFAMAPYAHVTPETPIYALSEFQAFKITEFIASVVVAKKTPLLEQSMYRVPEEIAAFSSGMPDHFERVLN